MDPGKGSQRRPTDQEKFSENFDRIFKAKKSSPGRRVFRQKKNPDGTFTMVELDDPPPKLSEDLLFEHSFISPVDGSLIRNRRELVDHNERNDVTQALPGMHDDVIRNHSEEMQRRKEQGRKDRIEIIKRELEKGER